MKRVAIISFKKIITTLGKQSWLGFEALWPTLQGRVTRRLQTYICEKRRNFTESLDNIGPPTCTIGKQYYSKITSVRYT
jgi:hypothetical protein